MFVCTWFGDRLREVGGSLDWLPVFCAGRGRLVGVELRNATALARPDLAENGILVQVQRFEQVVMWYVPDMIWQQSAKDVSSICKWRQVRPEDGFVITL